MSSELALNILGAHGSRWKLYPAYRDSGVEWIGEVPEGWKILPLRRVVYRFVDYRGKTPEKVDSGVPLITAKNIKGGHIDLSSSKEFIRENEYQDWMTRGLPENGDVLITTEAPLGEVAQVESTYIALAQRIILLKVKKSRITNSYLKYHFLSKSGQGELWTQSSGSTALGIKADRFKGTLVSVPSLPEQRAIAAFLDRETGRIDTLIEKKERQIELLQEKRAALISHAVTKGLDPDVKMKDSGVEWLGEVPEDWKLKRIKQIASKIGSGKTPKGGSEVYSESGVTFLRSQNIHFDGLRLDDVVFIKESIDEEMFSTRVFSNDVLLNITGASLGRCSLVPDNFTPANVNQHVCIVRPIKKSIVPLFLYNVFASKVVQAQIFSWENGSSREGLTFPQIANLVIVAPDDLEEQHSIAAFLDRETERIDTLTTKVSESISKLREYRTALISAAVTGKIDVRNKET